LGLVVNLCGYPQWALSDLSDRAEAFFAAWQQFVRRVALALADRVAYYQLGNEFNTALDPVPAGKDARVFLAAAAALESASARYPAGSARTVVNPFYGFDQVGSDWSGALSTVLNDATPAIDVLAIDYYPASYDFWDDPGDWSPLCSLATYARRYDKLLAVGETGCPTLLLGEHRQADWYLRALAGLSREVEKDRLAKRMTYVNLFELTDRRSLDLWEFWRPTEITLGLSTQDLRPKAAFFALQHLIANQQSKIADTIVPSVPLSTQASP
ncbi:MAG: hypothetical protein KGR26_07815, partial [Cyanobacteria bacterium REEB65]|nr:hypothetical protein [Cyanobacteria bacterium REEB65]